MVNATLEEYMQEATLVRRSIIKVARRRVWGQDGGSAGWWCGAVDDVTRLGERERGEEQTQPMVAWEQGDKMACATLRRNHSRHSSTGSQCCLLPDPQRHREAGRHHLND